VRVSGRGGGVDRAAEVSEAARTGRFDQLRAYYRDKYNPPEPDEESVGAASSRNPFEDDSDGDEVNPLHGESPAKAAQPWYAANEFDVVLPAAA
jgi:hypothetical protein